MSAYLAAPVGSRSTTVFISASSLDAHQVSAILDLSCNVQQVQPAMTAYSRPILGKVQGLGWEDAELSQGRNRISGKSLDTEALDGDTQFGLQRGSGGLLDVSADPGLKSFRESDHNERQATIAKAEKERSHHEHEIRCLHE